MKSFELFRGEPHGYMIFYSDGNWIEKKKNCEPKGCFLCFIPWEIRL